MEFVRKRTATGGNAQADQVWWEAEIPQYEDLDEALDEIPGGQQGIVDHLNGELEQKAKQTDKDTPREAVNAAREAGYELRNVSLDEVRALSEEEGEPEVLVNVIEAIEGHQAGTRDTRLGVARSSDGPTQTEILERMKRVYKTQGPDEAERLLAEYEAQQS